MKLNEIATGNTVGNNELDTLISVVVDHIDSQTTVAPVKLTKVANRLLALDPTLKYEGVMYRVLLFPMTIFRPDITIAELVELTKKQIRKQPIVSSWAKDLDALSWFIESNLNDDYGYAPKRNKFGVILTQREEGLDVEEIGRRMDHTYADSEREVLAFTITPTIYGFSDAVYGDIYPLSKFKKFIKVSSSF
jgi:hypothetical protein